MKMDIVRSLNRSAKRSIASYNTIQYNTIQYNSHNCALLKYPYIIFYSLDMHGASFRGRAVPVLVLGAGKRSASVNVQPSFPVKIS